MTWLQLSLTKMRSDFLQNLLEEFIPLSFDIKAEIAYLHSLNINLNNELSAFTARTLAVLVWPAIIFALEANSNLMIEHTRTRIFNVIEDIGLKSLPFEYTGVSFENVMFMHKTYYSKYRALLLVNLYRNYEHSYNYIVCFNQLLTQIRNLRKLAIELSNNPAIQHKLMRYIAHGLGPVFHALLVEPVVIPAINHAVGESYYVNQLYLSKQAAQEYLKTLHTQTQDKIILTSRLKIINYVFTLLCLLASSEEIRNQYENPEISWVLCFAISSVITISFDLAKSFIYNESKAKFIKKIASVEKTFNAILTINDITIGICTIQRGRNFAESYLTFNAANHYKKLSGTVINQIVKDIFLKNGIKIVLYDTYRFSFNAMILTAAEIKNINTQISHYLERLLNIKKLFSQVTAYFENVDIIKKTIIIADLPSAIFIVHKTLEEESFLQLARQFSQCVIKRESDYISIAGNTPEEKSPSLIFKTKKTTSPVIDTMSISPNSGLRRVVKPAKAVTESISMVRELQAPQVTYRWPSGEFNSGSNNNTIKRINHKFFGKNHFILFALPRSAFPNDSIYNKIKNKVEEAHLASNTKGQQGLQFRPSQARDITKPEEPWFDAVLRIKLIGKLGDVRAYAAEEVVDDQHLYVFRGLNLSSH
jgi:hypothetical protein